MTTSQLIIMHTVKSLACVLVLLQLAGQLLADEKCKVDDRVSYYTVYYTLYSIQRNLFY